ncbi:DNA-binding response regulator [Shinella sp. WSJ-2]|uniref:response regulator n=1 Tax=Shinella sp. WSJ-2 TaxID=2303749 RepID=UPI000E3ED815|nr:response regulator [Shinella sp. WSJ-2]RFZ86736.1 DNA-binding response regulator [Shinella sp. WSJ-2]
MVKGSLENKRILILEDDPLLALDLEDYLTEQGATVVGPVSSVELALEAVKKGIDAAVLDLNLRGVYSYPVIEVLAEAGTPLVVCSGYAELPDTRMELTDIVLLPKPCDLNILQSRLAEQIAEASGKSS